MRILIVTGLYPGSAEGSNRKSSLAIHYYAREWAKTHEVEVIRTVSKNFFTVVFSFFKRRKFVVDGVSVRNRMIIGSRNNYLFLDLLVRFVSFKKYDLVIGHMPLGAYAAYLIGQRTKTPFIVGLHVTDVKRAFGNPVLTRRYKEIISKASLVAFRSMMIERKFGVFQSDLHEKSFLMPGGISPEWISSGLEPVSMDEKLQIVTICELLPRKNVHKVLNVLNKISKQVSFDYRIIGEGKEEERLYRQLQESEIHQNVKMVGYQSHDEIREILKRNMVMVLISESETFGLVYLEAMARGCIVIGTKDEGIDGVIKDGENGFLVSPNEDELAQCILRISCMSQEELNAISENAIISARNFIYPEMARSYLDTVRERLQVCQLVNN